MVTNNQINGVLDLLVGSMRWARGGLSQAVSGDVARARDAFLSRLVREAFSWCLEPKGKVLSSQEISERLGFSVTLAAREEQFDYLCCDARRPLTSDPLAIGWSYQIWNARERADSTWGVSKRDLRQAEQVEIGVVTQLFTDEYIAHFLVRRCDALCNEKEQNGTSRPVVICDPACGAGHILIEALRFYVCKYGTEVPLACRLVGFDIDPEVVELCRTLLLIEWLRLGFRSDCRAFWQYLQSAISVVPNPFGTLDRANRLPHVGAGFDIVVTNPPYLGRRKLSAAMRGFLDSQYPAARVDLCAAFMQRCVELTAEGGAVGFVASDKWLRLKGYSSLRNGDDVSPGLLGGLTFDSVCELGPRAFNPRISMHDGVRAALLCAHKKRCPDGHNFAYLNASQVMDYAEKVDALRAFSQQIAQGQDVPELPQQSLASDAGRVFLRVSGLPATLVDASRSVGDMARVVVGVQTNDDARFVRYVWQVPPDRSRWRVHSKGGGYGRWHGFNRWVIDWKGGAPHFFSSSAAREVAEGWIEKQGWTYTWFANGALGLRVKEAGWSFGRAAAAGVFVEDDRLVAFLNSRCASLCARSIGGKIQLPEGVVRQVPVPESLEVISGELVRTVIALKRQLVSLDPSDALWDPSVECAPRRRLVLESLVLLVEGAIEARVERAMGISSALSNELGERLGFPVAWFPDRDPDLSDQFWREVPEEYQGVRSLVESANESKMVTRESSPSIEPEAFALALDGRPPENRGAWSLPSSGLVESVCRAFRINPIDCVSMWRICLEVSHRGGGWLEREWIYRSALAVVLESIGHRWWSRQYEHSRPAVGVVAARDISEELLGKVSALKEGELARQPVERWLCSEFREWQSRVFCNASPIVFMEESQKGGALLGHVWDLREHAEAKACR